MAKKKNTGYLCWFVFTFVVFCLYPTPFSLVHSHSHSLIHLFIYSVFLFLFLFLSLSLTLITFAYTFRIYWNILSPVLFKPLFFIWMQVYIWTFIELYNIRYLPVGWLVGWSVFVCLFVWLVSLDVMGVIYGVLHCNFTQQNCSPKKNCKIVFYSCCFTVYDFFCCWWIKNSCLLHWRELAWIYYINDKVKDDSKYHLASTITNKLDQ